ncbi:MAG: hypothetical protein AB7H66_03245 [Hyphomonadaceae bacterium]
MRRNVLGWLSEQVQGARHALILTHNIDFLFVQSVLLPQLRQAGNPKLTIFADAMCAAQSFAQQRPLLDGLGARYRVVQVDLGAGRRFHPKALLLAGPERAALAIGSGNLTHGGMGANHEAWAFAVSDGEGAPLIAAFRDYATTLASTLPLSAALEDGIDAVFDPTHAWTTSLPPPAGLASSPSAVPILDQIATMVTGDVRSVDVLAPYHDDKAAALSTIASRFSVPITCWVQPGRAGLSQSAAAALPQNVSLKSVDCIEERRPSFIHAKVLAFHRAEDAVIVVGSANCSQAALLADSTWGNAEIVAVDVASEERATEFFSELVRSETPPPLPEHPPSEDWEEPPRNALRILAARQEGDVLKVAYHSHSTLTDLQLEAAEGVWAPTSIRTDSAQATFNPAHRVRVVALSGMTENGERVRSPQMWVDDEGSLAAPATLRRVFRRFQEGDQEADPAQTFRGVLELFGDYLRDPEAARRRVYRNNDETRPTGPYDPSVVFSDDFGVGSFSPHGAHVDAYAPTSILAIIEGMFSVGRGSTSNRPPTPSPSEPEEENNDPEAAQAALLRQSQQPRKNERTSAALRRAAIAVERALCDPKFVEARAPALLGADVAVAAVLLVKGLADGLLDVATYRESTRKIWQALFFGDGRAMGGFPARIEAIADTDSRATFIGALSNPRLSAAMALWSITEFGAEDADGAWFKYSAAALQEQCPWLLTGAAPDIVASEIALMAASLLPPNERETAGRAWIEVVRAGEALRALRAGLKQADQTALRAQVKSDRLTTRDLVWVSGGFAFPIADVPREVGAKAEVRFLGQARTARFISTFPIPVRELVEAQALALPPSANDVVMRLIDTMRTGVLA